MRALLAVVIVFLSTLALAQGAAVDNEGAQTTPTPVEQMDRLVQKGFEHAVKALESSGGFFPFGLVRDDQGRVHFLAYGGKPEERPSADAYAYELVWQMRNLTASNSSVRAALVVRPAVLTGMDGAEVPAMHFIVDHRERAPKSVIFPILKQGDEYYLGEPSVLDSDDFLMMNSPDAELQRQTGEPQ